MNLLICSERLLFRFGLDRVLIRLGQGFFDRGNRVSVMATRFDRTIVERFADRVIAVPLVAPDITLLNEAMAAWLERVWDTLFTPENHPDAVLIGGWPFYAAIPVFKKRVGCVVVEDVGAVPLDGFTGAGYVVQKKLRSLRRQYLREASSIAVISDFLARTQSAPDTDGQVPIQRIHLAADHVDQPDWGGDQIDAACSGGAAVARANELKAQGRRLILNLGRWEPGCYKNSEAAWDFMGRLQKSHPEAALLVLAERSALKIPPAFRGLVEPVGHPDDRELRDLMSACELGVSVSLWEGFNLPIVEMHWLRRPALALDLAAHPEVIGDPWYLCADIDAMADKAAAILAGNGPDEAARQRVYRRCRSVFRWERVVDEHLTLLSNAIIEARAQRPSDQVIFLDVTNSARDPGNPGIVRVARRLGQVLQRLARVYFVVWDQGRMAFVFPTDEEGEILSSNNGPVLDADHPRSKNDGKRRLEIDSVLERHPNITPWMLAVEIRIAAEQALIYSYLRSLPRPMRTAAIFYDAIPVLRPDLCSANIAGPHAGYMRALAQFDQIFSISEFSHSCLVRFWLEQGVAPAAARALVIPGEFGSGVRAAAPKTFDGKRVNILCVSTIEARKNHRTLIEAFVRVKSRRPDIAFSLTLVGNRYHGGGGEELAQWVDEQARLHPEIRWLGIVDDDELGRLYERASFTVYPSIIEGFGLPIMESLWHARPCICHNQGAMSELIDAGGGVAVDVRDPSLLADAIERLATDARLYGELSRQAAQRTIKTWNDYAKELLMALTDRTLGATLAAQPASRWQTDPSDILYPNCLLENWQMTDSERLGMTALLQRIEPRVAIEIGTFKGGSLSLLAQFAEMIFSLDIDPTIPEKFGYFENVSFLTGYSQVMLPVLLAELDEKGLYPDFLLIDGDHSAEGVKRDVAIVLKYVPKKPLFILMHDSFNPECRRGMLESAWAQSPYVHHVNLDFVPGRMIETGSARGEMWGGLGFAYLLPTPRSGELGPIVSADGMFRIVQRATAA
jgi:glycosyltransferase involved in cell wall biosynthesis